MSAPAKPKKTHRNQPAVFRQSLPAAPALAHTPAVALPRRHPASWKLIAVWILAAVIGGVGGGLVAANRLRSVTATVSPALVAGQLRVTAPTTPLTISRPATISAGSTNPQDTVLSQSSYQPGVGPDRLQPGFAQVAGLQGTRGTDPVY